MYTPVHRVLQSVNQSKSLEECQPSQENEQGMLALSALSYAAAAIQALDRSPVYLPVRCLVENHP